MSNQTFIFHPTFSEFSRQDGSLLRTTNPIRYVRVKAIHDEWILEVSVLARKPKQLKYDPEMIPPEAVFDTLEDAHAAKTKWEFARPAPVTKSRRISPTITDLDTDRIDAINVHVMRSMNVVELGPKRRGEKTLIILLLIQLGLVDTQVVAFMQTYFNLSTSRGTVAQRRRGLRIKGWEVSTLTRHGLLAS